ncbi:LEAF RUST 10 DISEASE-RESISTANCE LOCUS RECEPTOR-LIKE PROTEIN KINASE-like 1.2 isoform X2 [Triticum dicoccoides]|uniref:LEAF RUST 10 DISEASE-RESISTANCE LOCUS RECEPTOR-LIKE PROTEIN KINASE-like 1.2 isoform X2 n=1 Tax=Triticum dicoccoides TaxID=85692 RepID=UPI00188FD383|nr:LEAF RUST 10 DISEASE-RESISTANCE LOCUS RECEPTOR-LIKE PROTEIN KINASE-like 1.2 isoform X2 [Triticum dicoccoides]
MAHLPPHSLVLLFLAFHVFLASHGSPLPPSSTYDDSICSESFRCGSVDITYPFYLSNATGATPDYTPYSCGYTDLKIFCQGEGKTAIATLQLGRDKLHNYTVQNIFYENQAIILRDTEAFISGGKCPTVTHNVTFDREWLNYTESLEELTFFFGCHSTESDQPAPDPPLDKFQIDCKGFSPPPGSGDGFSFVFSSEEGNVSREHGLAEYCRQKVIAPVLQKDAARSGLLVLPWEYGVVLGQGFELEWKQSKDRQCELCEKSYGRCAYSEKKEFLSCLCSGGICKSNPNPPSSGSNKKKNVTIAGVVVGVGGALLVAAVMVFLFIRKRRQRKVVNSSSKLLKYRYSGSGGTPTRSRGGDMESGSSQDMGNRFSYEELEEATDSFNENRELGDGGFGTVYKGYLGDGRVVAVKRLYNNSYRRVEQFVNEAAILARLRHPNLVMFYGCTSKESRELLLVYEFVQNGTVADHLHGPRAAERALPWPLRLSIAVESAAALTYLHAIEPPIVHRDVKTNNILLDTDFHVKVADFGLSRLFPLDATHVSTAPQGTPGYVDPEYHQCYQLTDKSDVYSFGVVLVELISSKPAVDITRQRNEINLAGMAISKIQKCRLEELVDVELGYESDPAARKMMTMVAELAFRCLQQNGEMRPPIREVLDVLRAIQDDCLGHKDGGGKGKKDFAEPFSPNTVHAPWDSRNTTPNTSQ